MKNRRFGLNCHSNSLRDRSMTGADDHCSLGGAFDRQIRQ